MVVKIKQVSVSLVSDKVDLVSDLPNPMALDWINTPILSDEDAKPIVEGRVEVDNQEIVDWMLGATEGEAVLDTMATSVLNNGGLVSHRSGDGYIPGLRAGAMGFVSKRGVIVKKDGYATVRTPRGTFNVPVGKAVTFARRDILAWASVLWTAIEQWLGALIHWVKLPTPPITKRISFATVGRLTAPQFVAINPHFPVPLLVLNIDITSSRPQTMMVRFRGPVGQYETIYEEKQVKLSSGKNEVVLWATGFPQVNKFTLQLQPQPGVKTVIDHVYTTP